MKHLKLSAAIAAAAIALSGLAIGATSANAVNTKIDLAPDSTTTTLTVTGDAAAIKDHTFAAVRIGAYTYADLDGDTAVNLSVETDAKATYLAGVLNVVEKNWAISFPQFAGNPAGYIAEKMQDSNTSTDPDWQGKLRNLVTALAKNDDFKKAYDNVSAPTATGTDSGTATFTVPQGLYVIVDTTKNTTGGAYRTSIPMVVGTKIVAAPEPSAAAKQYDLKKQALGTVTVKNEPETLKKGITQIANPAGTEIAGSVDHQVDRDKNSGYFTGKAAIGDIVSYRIAGATIPSTVGYDAADAYTFKFTDTLEKGQTFRNDLKVSICKSANSCTVLPASDGQGGTNYTLGVTPATTVETQDTTIIVDMGAYVHKQGITTAAGSEIVITYTAMLNNGAIVNPSGSNDNTVKLEYSNNPLDPTDFGTITPPNTQVFVGAFSLKKTDKHGTGLGGDAAADRAQFQVATKAAPNMPLYFTVLNADEGSYKLADAQTSGTGRIAVLTVGKLGELKLSGLEGDYSLKESRAPKNYSGAFLPQFTVNVTTDLGGLTSTGSAIGNQYTDTVNSLVTLTAKDTWQLVQGTKDAAVVATTPITVWNVTSVTELPMTGAAGITLFAVLAVLTGGVALVFVLKSRNSRNTPIAV